jgi:hypothetical protein
MLLDFVLYATEDRKRINSKIANSILEIKSMIISRINFKYDNIVRYYNRKYLPKEKIDIGNVVA